MLCNACKQNKPEKQFQLHYINKNGINIRRRKCNACKDLIRIRRRNKIVASLNKIKESYGCKRCGVTDFRVLQFHHRDSNDKKFNISDRCRSDRSLTTLLKEVVKCDVLCANCHFILHYEEKNSL